MWTHERKTSSSGDPYWVARIVLADGHVAGEGRAGTRENAEAFAVKDAAGGTPRERLAARGHAKTIAAETSRYFVSADNRVVARSKSRAGAHRASRRKKNVGSRVVTTTTSKTVVQKKSLNMARLSSRGRRELVRLSKASDTPDSSLTVSERVTVALMSDGNVLEKRDVRWKDGGAHSYGWSVRGKIKPGLSVADFARIYEKRGFVAEGVSPSSGEQVVRTEAKAASQKKAAEKRRAKAAEVAVAKARKAAIEDGPGFYVTNEALVPGGSVASMMRAAELGPFATLDEALPAAWARLQEFRDMKFDYLMPVQVVEASSRFDAQMRGGHVWWTDGRRRGAPVPEEQTRFANMRSRG